MSVSIPVPLLRQLIDAADALSAYLPAASTDEPAADTDAADDIREWYFTQVATLFPKSSMPDPLLVDEVWELAGHDKALIEDLFFIYTKMTKPIVSVGALMRSELQRVKGDTRGIRAKAAVLRKQAQKDTTSQVERAMQNASARLATLPPKTGLNLRGVERLKLLTKEGREKNLIGTPERND